MLSARLHQADHPWAAKVIKSMIFLSVRALLAPEAHLGRSVSLTHHGIGTVVHPNVTLGDDVRLFHGVTLGTDVPLADPRRMIIGDRTVVGAGAVVIGPVTIGADVVVGANSVVVSDIPGGKVVAGNPARIVGDTESTRAKLVSASEAAAEHPD
jgi:serine O-acetyltransferase